MRSPLFLFFACWLTCGILHAQAPAKPTEVDRTQEVFKPGSIKTFKLVVSKESRDKLRANDNEYVKCDVVVGETTYTDVAVKIKGAAGSRRAWDDRPALTLNFDKFHNKQKYETLSKLHLNNSVQDASYLHEILGSELAAKLGLPTASAAHALVELNERKMGLAVLKEGYNSGFVKRYFPKTKEGNLYDGGFLQDIDSELKLDSGEDVKHADLKAISKACEINDRDKRYEAVTKLVDVELFTKNAALQIVMTDWDGYCRNHNNYRVFVPKNGLAVFIPHGMDQLLQSPEEGLWHGWNSRVGRAILDHPEGKAKTIAVLKEIMDQHFQYDAVSRRIDEWTGPASKALEDTGKKTEAITLKAEVKQLKNRVKSRIEYVTRELPKLK